MSEAGYERTRRACAPCAGHLTAGEFSCPARYAIAIATPGGDIYHKHAAIRHLSAAMEASTRKTSSPAWGGDSAGQGGRIVDGEQGANIVGPLEAIQGAYGGPRAVFVALVPMLSTEVGRADWGYSVLARFLVLPLERHLLYLELPRVRRESREGRFMNRAGMCCFFVFRLL